MRDNRGKQKRKTLYLYIQKKRLQEKAIKQQCHNYGYYLGFYIYKFPIPAIVPNFDVQGT